MGDETYNYIQEQETKMKGIEEISDEDLLLEESIIECIQDNADCMYDDIVSEDDDKGLEMEDEVRESKEEEEGQIHETCQGNESEEEEGQIDESQSSESEEEGQIDETKGSNKEEEDLVKPSQHQQSLVCDEKRSGVGGDNGKIHKLGYENMASVFVGDMPKGVGDDGLRRLFCRFGKILSARVLTDKYKGASRGCGFVNFENASDATMAIQYMDGYIMDGCCLNVRVAGSSSGFGREIDATLYVCHLPTTMDERRLADLFCPFGKICRVSVIRDACTGKSRGYGFVVFDHISDADMARLVMNGYKVQGHTKLLVSLRRRPKRRK